MLGLAMGAAAGCAPANLHYRLELSRSVVLLVPPSANRKPLRIHITLPHRPTCAQIAGNSNDGRFSFRWQLADSDFQLDADPAVGHFRGNLPVPLLAGITGMRATLERAVAAGCLPEAARTRVLRRVIESMSMAPDLAQDIVLGPYGTQRYADLGDGMGLTLTYALDPSRPGRYDLGYVTRQYRFIRATPDGRGRLQHEATAVRAAPAPAALLAASSRPALESATHALLTVLGICAKLRITGANCLLAPPDIGLDAEVRVTVQGRRVAVPLPATVEQALLAAAAPPADTILAQLRVARAFHGSLIPVEAPSNPRLLL
ncbi:MAG: hypothetical protein ACRD2D_12965, partial [Terriglobales bacterium]